MKRSINVNEVMLVDTIYYICTDFQCAFSISYWEGVLTSLTIIVDLSISSYGSINYCFMHF